MTGNKNLYFKKRRNNCDTGTLYTLTWVSRIDGDVHSETILSKDVNPISEDYVKHMLIMMAVHNDPDSLLATLADNLPVQEDEFDNHREGVGTGIYSGYGRKAAEAMAKAILGDNKGE